MHKWFIMLVTCLSLVGCSVFKPMPRQTINNYELGALSLPSKQPIAASGRIILVSNTTSSPGYETNGIVYSKSPYQLNTYTQNRWVAPPAQLFNQALVSSLRKSHYFKAVATIPYIGLHDFRLDTQLLELKQDLSNQQLRMSVAAQLVDSKKQTIIASKQFSVNTATLPNPKAAVNDANKAQALMLSQIVDFCLTQAKH